LDSESIRQQLSTVFQQVFQQPGLEARRDMTAADVENWTSLTHMEMFYAVEKAFGIKFKLQEINNPRKMRHVGDLIDLIQSKLNT
jgi:acyl carrier protein